MNTQTEYVEVVINSMTKTKLGRLDQVRNWAGSAGVKEGRYEHS